MILYNITVNVDKEVESDWLHWMQNDHIQSIMKTELFEESKIFRLMQDEPQGVTYSCQFFAEEISKVMTFQSQFAQRLQAEVFARFGSKVVDFRTVMEEI